MGQKMKSGHFTCYLYRSSIPALYSQQRAQQHVEVDPVGFDPPSAPFHRDARWVHHLHFNALCLQIPCDPEPVPAGLLPHL